MLLLAAFVCSLHPAYALKPLTGAIAVRRDGAFYRASATLRFRIDPAIRRPSSADAGFDDHVRGHQIIAQKVARSSIGLSQAAGRTAEESRRALRRALGQMAADAQRELDREERVYDSVTEDGAAQDQGPLYGLPGGANTRDRCVH